MGSWPLPVRALYRNVCFLVSLPAGLLLCFLLLQTPSDQTPWKLGSDAHRSPETRQLEASEAALPSPDSYYERGDSQTEAISGPTHEFLIHIWRHGSRMRRRFLRSYGAHARDPYRACAVRNCRLTGDIQAADAVLFHLHQTSGPDTLPPIHPSHQIWIFFTDESPLHTFYASHKYSMRHYNGLFNWSMTYRSDADVPVPYGRTVRLSGAELRNDTPPNYHKQKPRGVAILGSNCGGQNHRWDYVHELQRHLEVDIYGACGNKTCPGHFTRDCPIIDEYKFYLAFENSDCREYFTEKLWWNAFEKGAVPVVMGGAKEDYLRLCPPKSFIHVGDFKGPAELARYLLFLMHNETAYNSYFDWKQGYQVVNEHGYFGSPSMHLCHICEALNRQAANPQRKVYRDLASFWSAKRDCSAPVWTPPD